MSCRGWACQFKEEMGELKTFFYPIKIKIWFLEENGESTPGPISVITEEPKEKDLESPESHIGLWLVLGLVLGLMICVGVGLKKVYNFCKKGNYSICFQFFLNYLYFQIEGFYTGIL